MAIDPTTPLTPILPSVPAGAAPDSVVLQAVARQALTKAQAQLGEIVGRPAAQVAGKAGAPVEQAGQASTHDAGQTPDTTTTKAAPTSPQALSPRATQETVLARAVRVAAAEAVPRQAGMAPLMADVRAVVERPDTPPEVREAGKALLAQARPAAELTSPQGLRQAVERSGVFLEARMARAAPSTAFEAASRPMGGEVDMKAALLVFRGALSAWVAKAAPSVSDRGAETVTLTPTEAPPTASEPEASPQMSVRPSPSGQTSPTPAGAGPASAATPEEAPPATTSSAPAQSYADPATPPVASPAVTTPPASAAEEMVQPLFAGFVAPPKTVQPSTPPVRSVLSALVQLGLMTEDEQASPSSAPMEPRPLVTRGYGAPPPDTERSKAPPPPYAGGPMAGQKPGASTITAGMSTLDAVRRLLKETGGALARQDLMQIASLQDVHPDAEASETRPQPGARLNMDLPFVTPQGVAVAQFEISHDGGGSGGGAVGPIERTYKARFSIDVEPLGPVHALITLTGSRTRVSLWAERAETIARLRAGEESLAAGLSEADLAPEVAVHSGAPPTAVASPLGHFVDQAS